MTTAPLPGEATFWALADPLLREAGVTRSTMMGYPCLRLGGAFFAGFDRRADALVVKLDERRVTELVATRGGVPFAPNGRRFRAWVTIPVEFRQRWPGILDEALEAASTRSQR